MNESLEIVFVYHCNGSDYISCKNDSADGLPEKDNQSFFSIVSFLCAICCFGSHGHTGSVFSYKEFWIIRHRFCGSGDSLIQRNEHRHGSLFKLCGSFGSGDDISDIIRKRRRL